MPVILALRANLFEPFSDCRRKGWRAVYLSNMQKALKAAKARRNIRRLA